MQLIGLDSTSDDENTAVDEAPNEKLSMTNISTSSTARDTSSGDPKKSNILHPSEESAPEQTESITNVYNYVSTVHLNLVSRLS